MFLHIVQVLFRSEFELGLHDMNCSIELIDQMYEAFILSYNFYFNIIPFLQLCIRNHHQNQKVLNQQKLHHHKSSRESESISTSRSSYQRPKLANRGVGNGMRAIFLESRNGSCGTGVFLPQRADTKFQPRKRPG